MFTDHTLDVRAAQTVPRKQQQAANILAACLVHLFVDYRP